MKPLVTKTTIKRLNKIVKKKKIYGIRAEKVKLSTLAMLDLFHPQAHFSHVKIKVSEVKEFG